MPTGSTGVLPTPSANRSATKARRPNYPATARTVADALPRDRVVVRKLVQPMVSPREPDSRASVRKNLPLTVLMPPSHNTPPTRRIPSQVKPNDLMPGAASADMTFQRAICAFTRQGAYPHVAAQAVGLPLATYDKWMSIGASKTRSIHGIFRLAVLEAQSQARLAAEQALFTDDPVAWLKAGPGKERPDNPGWSTSAKPAAAAQQATQVNVFSGELALVMQRILAALAHFPDARLAVAAVLEGGGERTSKGKPRRGSDPDPESLAGGREVVIPAADAVDGPIMLG